jgi:hypothetical protein
MNLKLEVVHYAFRRKIEHKLVLEMGFVLEIEIEME